MLKLTMISHGESSSPIHLFDCRKPIPSLLKNQATGSFKFGTLFNFPKRADPSIENEEFPHSIDPATASRKKPAKGAAAFSTD